MTYSSAQMSEAQPNAIADYDYILSAVQLRFTYTEHYLREDGTVEFKIDSLAGAKEKFKDLLAEIKSRRLVALLRQVSGSVILAVGKDVLRVEYSRRTPVLLLIATLGTIAVDGWFRTGRLPGQNSLWITLLYTLAVIGIIGTHELGHKLISRIHNMRSSQPYFIPGIPSVIPTMGAVITSAEPPVNRDSLFDLGLSGPIAGLVVTFFVAIAGALTSYLLPEAIVQREVQAGNLQLVGGLDLFTAYLLNIFGLGRPPTGMDVIISPLVYASSLGFLITFLNLLPAWQLDGGHIARAVLDRSRHRIATYASVALLFFLGFYFMALIIFFLSTRSAEMRPLDDISPLSQKRKLAFIGVIVLAAVLYAIMIRNNPFFFR